MYELLCVCLFGLLMLSVPLIDREEGNEQSVTLTATESIPDTNRLFRYNTSCHILSIKLFIFSF